MAKNSAYILIIFSFMIFNSCSELAKDTIPTEPKITIHPSLFSESKNHGDYIRSINWDINTCKNCHSNNFSGGVSEKSCNTCHNKQNGPANCITCHGTNGNSNFAPPRDLSKNLSYNSRGVGAHQNHLIGSANSAKVDCNVCHNVPTELNSENHLGNDNIAEIILNKNSKFYTENFNYNFFNGSCSNSYCHGNFNNGNKNNSISWTSDSSAVDCGTCHGDKTKNNIAEKSLPKTLSKGGYHPDELNCSNCHDSVIDQNYKIIASQKHINGIIDFKK